MKEVKKLKVESPYFYKISHCYMSEKESIFFKSPMTAEELIEVLACLDFTFEEMVDETNVMNGKSVLNLLVTFYGVEQVSEELVKRLRGAEPEEYEESGIAIIPKNHLMTFYQLDGDDQLIEIDRYAAREYCCGPNYSQLMRKHLHHSNEFMDMIKNSTIS